MSGLTALDRICGWLSPHWGYKRAQYRLALRSYDAARVDPQGGNWFPLQNATPEMTDAPHRGLIRGRMRDMERNGDVTEGIIDAIVRNVVEGGFGLEARAMSARGKPLDAINDRIEELWNKWSQAENCDVTGDSSFGELLEIIVRRWEVDGEIFILKVVDPEGFLPIKLQLLEPDMLAEDVFQSHGHYVFGGVEVDEYMKAVAYHFRPDPMPYFRDQTIVRYPREDIIHVHTKKRPQQIRSMSDMTVCSERVRNLQEYVTNELEASRNAAAITALVSPMPGNPGIGRRNTTPSGKVIEKIQRGQINYINEGNPLFPTPGRPNVNASGFVSFLLRMIAMARGLSYETVSRDVSQVNYSSFRGGQLEDRKTFRRRQKKITTDFCDRVYEWFIEAALLSGKLSLPGYFEDEKARDRYLRHQWSTPGWKWVDPQKEAAGVEKQLALGITTLREVCGEQGKDWYDVLQQRKSEMEAAEELGIKLSWMSGQETTSPEEYEQFMKDEDNPPGKKKEGEDGSQEE